MHNKRAKFASFSVIATLMTMVVSPTSAQSILGVQIGASPSSLQSLGLKQIKREGDGALKITKYKLKTGNDFSVTFDSQTDKILYAEIDWNLQRESRNVGAQSLTFGVTSLADLRRKHHSNGLSWKRHMMFDFGDGVLLLNAFEISNTPDSIVVYGTRVSKKEYEAAGSDRDVLFASLARLTIIILASEAYLDQIWGNDKVYDGAAKPVTWSE